LGCSSHPPHIHGARETGHFREVPIVERILGRTDMRLSIGELLGHKKIDTTIKYICVKMDEMSVAMEELSQYQRLLICLQKGIFNP